MASSGNRVLVTGAAGRVGRVVAAGLGDRFRVRGFDREPMPDIDDVVVGDLAQLDDLHRACQGVDAIIHLGGRASGASEWAEVLNANFIGTYNVFEAASAAGINRVAVASRAGLLRDYPEQLMRTVAMYPHPRDYYSISKLFCESIGYMYAQTRGMEVVAVRIGSFVAERPGATHPHHLSHRDCVQVFERAITQPGVRFEIVFGVSGSEWPLYDLENGRRAIGYDPQDVSRYPFDDPF